MKTLKLELNLYDWSDKYWDEWVDEVHDVRDQFGGSWEIDVNDGGETFELAIDVTIKFEEENEDSGRDLANKIEGHLKEVCSEVKEWGFWIK